MTLAKQSKRCHLLIKRYFGCRRAGNICLEVLGEHTERFGYLAEGCLVRVLDSTLSILFTRRDTETSESRAISGWAKNEADIQGRKTASYCIYSIVCATSKP